MKNLIPLYLTMFCAGHVFGQDAGHVFGQGAGQVSGQSAEDVFGQSAEDVFGQGAGHVFGQSAVTVFGQDSAKTAKADEVWSVDRCMAYAATCGGSVRMATIDLDNARYDRKQATAEFLPSVGASVGGQFSWGRNINPETNTYNNITNFGNSYGIAASLLLFDGGATVYQFKRACTAIDSRRNNVRLQQDLKAIECMTAYFDALYYLKSIEIAADKLSQSKNVLTLTRKEEELGMKGLPDVAQAEATAANDEYNLIQQRNLHNRAMIKLRTVMNVDADANFSLDTVPPQSSNISQGFLADDNPDLINEMADRNNPKAIESNMSVKEAELRYKQARASLFPTISLDGGISTSYYKTLSHGYANTGFAEQFRNNRGEYIGATLSIPLFSNLRNVSSMRKARNELARAKIEREEALRGLHDDIEAAVADRNGYAAELTALESKLTADELAYRLNLRKYEEGLTSITDMQLTANTYFESKVNLLRTRLLYILKQRLVNYYKGEQLWTSR